MLETTDVFEYLLSYIPDPQRIWVAWLILGLLSCGAIILLIVLIIRFARGGSMSLLGIIKFEGKDESGSKAKVEYAELKEKYNKLIGNFNALSYRSKQ